jgi:membrane-associated phospholipid phosphatase
MIYRSPYERQLGRRRALKRLALLTAVLVVSLWMDGPMFRWLGATHEPTIMAAGGVSETQTEIRIAQSRSAAIARKAKLESQDWYQMFRSAGYLPTWLLIGGGIWLIEHRGRRHPSRGLAIILGAMVTGLMAEILKLVFGRHRPMPDGSLDWNPLFGAILLPDTYGHSLGLPSSHAAVAFGAAFVVMRVYPGTGWVAMSAAIGCALTRMLAGAHVLSDVVVAAMLAGLISSMLVRMIGLRDDSARASRFD